MNNGYDFYFKVDDDVLTFPITPSELSIKVGSNNEVVNLINEGDINILKSPSLTEVEFEARFPMRQYPYARAFTEFQTYFDTFKELKENKKSFRFIVARTTPHNKRTWDTNLLMAIEDMELTENAEEGDDVLITFKLKQFKPYSVKILKRKGEVTGYILGTLSGASTPSPGVKESTKTRHVVQEGETLWTIAKQYYGDETKYTLIYEANKSTIENMARKNNKASSSNGWWVYPGTKLVIP